MTPKCLKIRPWGAPGAARWPPVPCQWLPAGLRGAPGGLWGSFWFHFGSILESKMVPKTIKKVIQNLDTFQTTFWRGFGTLGPLFLRFSCGGYVKITCFTFLRFCQFLAPFWAQNEVILASKSLQKSIKNQAQKKESQKEQKETKKGTQRPLGL